MATQARVIDEKTVDKRSAVFILLALVLIPFGIWLFFAAAADGHIQEVQGKVASLEGVYQVGSGKYARYVQGSRAGCGDGDFCGQYDYSVLTTYEDSADYRINPDEGFQPALPRWFAQEDEPVRFWYTRMPLGSRYIIAITVDNKTYHTDAYVHPRRYVVATALGAALACILGFSLGLAGIYLPRLVRRYPRLADFLAVWRVTAPAPRHHKYTPIRPVTRVAKGAPTATRRRAHR